jgi:hypothetical protein
VLCAGSTLLLVQSYALDKAPYKLSGAIAKLASINLLKFGSFSYWFDKPWFHTQGRLVVVLITPSLGVSNWAVIYKTPTSTPHHQPPAPAPRPNYPNRSGGNNFNSTTLRENDLQGREMRGKWKIGVGFFATRMIA